MSLGPRPTEFRTPTALSPWRGAIPSVAIILAYLSVFAYANVRLLDQASISEQIEVNFLMVAGYSAVLAYLWYRSGLHAAALVKTGRDLFEGLPMGVGVVDEKLRVEYANPAMARVCGRRRGAVRGEALRDLVAPTDIGRIDAFLVRLADGRVTAGPLRFLWPGGETADTIMTALPFTRSGEFDGAFVFLNDMTEYLEVRNSALRYRNLSGYFFDLVTHEMSNGMQTLLTRLEMMRTTGSDPSPSAEALRDATLEDATLEAATRMAQLVRDVKALAKAERELWPKAPRPLAAVLSRAVALAGAPPAVRVTTRVEGGDGDPQLVANELFALGVAKLIEEAALGVPPEDPEVSVMAATVRGDRGAPAVAISVSGSTHALPEGAAEALGQGLGGFHLGEATWRSGIRLALAAAIFRAQDIPLHMERTDRGGALYRVVAPSPGGPPHPPGGETGPGAPPPGAPSTVAGGAPRG